MRHQVSGTFNKEKFIFLGIAAVAAVCVYNFLASRPVPLEVGIPVSPLPIPAPLAAEKPDPRKGDVSFYLVTAQYSDGVAINRDRNDPFAPIYVPTPAEQAAALTTVVKQFPAVPIILPPKPIEAPNPEEEEKRKREEAKKFALKEFKAKVDFSAVIAMGGVTYGLLKDDAGNTMQVKVGDYLEDFKYTVSKIDKQAIWVTDENDRLYVARDLSFADNAASTSDGEDEKPGKKKNAAVKGGPKAGAKSDANPAASSADANAAAALALGKQALDMLKNQNQNNTILNPNAGGRKSRRNGK
jgi:hypothetical protein